MHWAQPSAREPARAMGWGLGLAQAQVQRWERRSVAGSAEGRSEHSTHDVEQK
jgi:hypothetical protein